MMDVCLPLVRPSFSNAELRRDTLGTGTVGVGLTTGLSVTAGGTYGVEVAPLPGGVKACTAVGGRERGRRGALGAAVAGGRDAGTRATGTTGRGGIAAGTGAVGLGEGPSRCDKGGRVLIDVVEAKPKLLRERSKVRPHPERLEPLGALVLMD